MLASRKCNIGVASDGGAAAGGKRDVRTSTAAGAEIISNVSPSRLVRFIRSS
jgi:hypothetical protein